MPSRKESFEEQMGKLSLIVTALEKEDVPLETLLSEYEKGTALVKTLQEKLDAAQASLKMLSGGKVEDMSIDA